MFTEIIEISRLNLALMIVLTMLLAAIVALWGTRAERRDAILFEFLEQSGYSLQCLRGINGDDNTWQVTAGSKLVGTSSHDMREAIRSAIQETATSLEAA